MQWLHLAENLVSQTPPETDWNQALSVFGVGFGGVLMVMVILMGGVIISSTIAKKIDAAKKQKTKAKAN